MNQVLPPEVVLPRMARKVEAVAPARTGRGKWREGNQIALLENGEGFFPRVFAAIAAAQRFIHGQHLEPESLRRMVRASLALFFPAAEFAEAGSGLEAIERLSLNATELMVLDLNMPAPNALEIARTLADRGHPAKIVLLTSDLTDEDIAEAMQLGIAGIVLKETAPQQLLSCLDTVAAGRQWFDPEIARRAMATAGWQAPPRRACDILTRRELDVARLVAKGLRNKEVARELTITEGTVKMYLHNIYDKLEIASRVELANIAREQGLL